MTLALLLTVIATSVQVYRNERECFRYWKKLTQLNGVETVYTFACCDIAHCNINVWYLQITIKVIAQFLIPYFQTYLRDILIKVYLVSEKWLSHTD